MTGFLVEFISLPVTSGFISAAAITIASSQIKSILGIGGKGNEFVESWSNVFSNIGNTNVGDLVLGLCTIVLLLIGQVSVVTRLIKLITRARILMTYHLSFLAK